MRTVTIAPIALFFKNAIWNDNLIAETFAATPGMPVAAAGYADKVGHIMNYGDGYYGGLFVASLYSEALVQNNLKAVINNALKMIPPQSQFHKIISDVLAEHERQSTDWREAWVVLALLYGNEDFGRTLDIATRAGDDADCNPAT